jgi:hypothetical protein
MDHRPIDDYLDGIRQEISEGRIIYGRPDYPMLGPADEFTHITKGEQIGKLSNSNTKHPSNLGMHAYRYILSALEGRPVAMLDLGAGAGQEPYQFYLAAENRNPSAEIDTVAQTPINPYYGFPKKSVDIACDIVRFFAANRQRIGAVELEMLARLATESSYAGLPLSSVLDFQAIGLEAYIPLKRPFVHKQYIIDFNDPNERSLIQRSYDYIYDCTGALFHADDYAKADGSLFKLIGDEGILYSTDLRSEFIDKIGKRIEGKEIMVPHEFIAVCQAHNSYERSGIICRADSMAGQAVIQAGKEYGCENRVIRVPDLANFISAALPTI